MAKKKAQQKGSKAGLTWGQSVALVLCVLLAVVSVATIVSNLGILD